MICKHGRPAWCHQSHDAGSSLSGRPICADCYDYAGHVIWQWYAPELWRRFTIALTRALARSLGVSVTGLREVASIQFAKVAEYQRRGVVHFHALIRLDGPKDRSGLITAPPPGITADRLAGLVRGSFAQTRVIASAVDDEDVPRELMFGAQLDARAVHSSDASDGGQLTASQVAGYIAKYATKTITDPDTSDANSPHHARLRQVVAELHARAVAADPSDENPYVLLGKWDHMLGFRGHFSTKSRRYSTTLGALRQARRRWQSLMSRAARERVRPADLRDEDNDETTLVIGQWRYAGRGWHNQGEVELAKAAAARARERQRESAIPRRPGIQSR